MTRGHPDRHRPQPTRRHSARVIVVDPAERVLLLGAGDPARPGRVVWHMPGGGLEPGETDESAARRELAEETGIDPDVLIGPVWNRRFEFSFDGVLYDQSETYFFARVNTTVVDESGQTDLERRSLTGFRWWSTAQLHATEELVAPADLADRLQPLLSGQFPPAPIEVAGPLRAGAR